MNQIVETTCNRLYRVRETGDAALSHVWIGVEVKKLMGGFVDKAKARPTLVRKEGTKILVSA
jgi:hypothetical protein